jgi:GT2 family glycosyltransferase/SAM-dependent methyltransferase
MNPSVSVILCTRNRHEKVGNAIDSILLNSFKDYELLVIDQSTDGKTEAVVDAASDRRIRYIRTDTVGLARARNVGIGESSAEVLAFTDDDCICDADWLRSIIFEFESDPSIMGVYGRVLPHADGGPGMICQCVIESKERRTLDGPAIPYTVLGHGNNMAFKKEVFRKIGLYIESLGAGTWMRGGEDTELTYRALKKGLKFVYSPRPLVYHDNWMCLKKATELEASYILPSVAVFTKFFLKLDWRALLYVARRGGQIFGQIGYHIVHTNGSSLAHATLRLQRFLAGLIMGIKYVFVPVPKFDDANKSNCALLKRLSMEDIAKMKELYIHPFRKEERIISDIALFQDSLNISAHYRRVKGLDTPYDVDYEQYHVDSDICGVWEYAFIILHMPLQKDLTVFEAASAASLLPAYLANLGYNVISADLETSYQEQIRKQSCIKYHVVNADLTKIPLSDNSVDVIISNSAIEHVSDDFELWKEFTRILKKGGKMIHTFPVGRPGYRSAWFQEPVDFFENPTRLHNRTHRLVDKKIAEKRYFIPNNLWLEVWEEHFYHREIQAYCVVVKE